MDSLNLRACVLVEQQYQEMEVWYPVYRLREAGCKVTLVGPEAGQTYPSKLGYPAKSDKAAKDVQADDFDVLVIPGGFAPDFLRRTRGDASGWSATWPSRARSVAAICHGPWVLCSTQALKGKQGDLLLRHQGRRDQRRRKLRRRRGGARRQPHHQPQARRPAGVHQRRSCRRRRNCGRCGCSSARRAVEGVQLPRVGGGSVHHVQAVAARPRDERGVLRDLLSPLLPRQRQRGEVFAAAVEQVDVGALGV